VNGIATLRGSAANAFAAHSAIETSAPTKAKQFIADGPLDDLERALDEQRELVAVTMYGGMK
jgi:hypothetical protein